MSTHTTFESLFPCHYNTIILEGLEGPYHPSESGGRDDDHITQQLPWKRGQIGYIYNIIYLFVRDPA